MGKPPMTASHAVRSVTLSSLRTQAVRVSATTIQPSHGSYLMPTLEHATVSDAMHPGILSGKRRRDAHGLRAADGHAPRSLVAVMGIAQEGPGEQLVWDHL